MIGGAPALEQAAFGQSPAPAEFGSK
jgi:hypothetical protein